MLVSTRSPQISMPERFLDEAERCAFLHRMGSVGVSHPMGGCILDASFHGIFFDDPPDLGLRESALVRRFARLKHIVLGRSIWRANRDQFIPDNFMQWNRARLTSLAENGNLPSSSRLLHIFPLKSTKFCAPDSTPIQN